MNIELLPSRSKHQYFRGNLHGHTTHSDGALSPEDVVKHYQQLGYDFICLSDHLWTNKDYCAPDVLDSSSLNTEIHCLGKKYVRDGLWHIVANGLPLDFLPASDQETAPELVNRALQAGAFVTIAHPDWYSLTFDEIMSVSHAHGVEIFNNSCHIEAGRGGGIAAADYLLQEKHKIVLTATDDSHFRINDAGGGWVMVAAKELSEQALLDALKKGQYYSSTGVEILKFSINEKKVQLVCSPASHVCVAGSGSSSKYHNGQNLTSVELDLTNFNSDWFRITIIDCIGRCAWTNPIWI
jgi:histidinol phosphatase-like PHP family hydrolase